MNKLKSILVVIVFAVSFSSCYYDNREELYPDFNTNCDTLDITFNKSVQPILQSNCMGCHSSSASSISGGGIALENYSEVKSYGENGKLFGAINHEAGYSPMPKNSGKLDDCSLLIIEKWIEQGYLEN